MCISLALNGENRRKCLKKVKNGKRAERSHTLHKTRGLAVHGCEQRSGNLRE